MTSLLIAVFTSLISVWFLVFLFSNLLFKKKESPKRELFALPLAWMVASIAGGYMNATTGVPRFDVSLLQYGIGAFLLLIYYVSAAFAKKRASDK
jgi:uncharacterized membrane protein